MLSDYMIDQDKSALRLVLPPPHRISHNLFPAEAMCERKINRIAGLILGLGPANERRRYFVTTSLIDWVQA